MSASSSGQVLWGMPWYVLKSIFWKPGRALEASLHLLGKREAS